MTEPFCVDCGQPATSALGIIYIRHKLGLRWTTSAVCDDCWRQREGDRVPVRVARVATASGDVG